MIDYDKLYKETPFEPLEPSDDGKNVGTFKFNSVIHFASWIESLDKNFKRNASYKSSQTENSSFCLSRDLEDGFKVVREAKFDPSDIKRMEEMIRKIKKTTRYAEEGNELDVPEYVGGSDNYWIKDDSKLTVSNIIDDHIFVEAGYNENTDAKDALKAGVNLIEGIYSRRIIPRKMTVTITVQDIRSEEPNLITVMIDVNFRDVNGLAKALHPSLFRRLIFRLLETYPGLGLGYGRHYKEYQEGKGKIEIKSLIGESEDTRKKKIDEFLGIKKEI